MISYYAEKGNTAIWLCEEDTLQECINNGWDIYESKDNGKDHKLSAKEIEDLKINNPFTKKQEQETYTKDEVLAIIAEALGGEPK